MDEYVHNLLVGGTSMINPILAVPCTEIRLVQGVLATCVDNIVINHENESVGGKVIVTLGLCLSWIVQDINGSVPKESAVKV